MPELPEVEAVCRRLRETLRSPRIFELRISRASITRPQSPDEVAGQCRGRRIAEVARLGKNILLHLDDGHFLRVHLRMTGNLYVVPDARFQQIGGRAQFRMSDNSAIVFDDPRALGKIHLHDSGGLADLRDEIGPEPRELSAPQFAEAAKSTRLPVKLFLMDQKRIAGLGNIYAAECLFRARIHPARPANSLSRATLARLHGKAVEVLAEGMESAWKAYAAPGAFAEGETFAVEVYDREGEPCGRCRRKIRRMRQGGRSTYFCPGCQR